MLPDVPEQKSRLMTFVQRYLRTAPYRANPLLGRLNTFVQHEGEDASFQRVDGKVKHMGYQTFSDTLSINGADIPTLTLEKLCGMMDEIGRKMAEAKFRSLLAKVDEAVEESGNSFDMKGQPFSQEHYFQVLEGISMHFDEDGSWEHPTIIANPKQAKNIQEKLAEWSKEESFRKKMDELIERKRKQFYDRENLRQLAD